MDTQPLGHRVDAVKAVRDLTGRCGDGNRRPRAASLPPGQRGPLTQAQEGEEVEPEEAQDGRSQGLVHSREMDPFLELGWEVGKVEVVPVHHVLEQDVDEACGEGAVSWRLGWATGAPLCPELGPGLL